MNEEIISSIERHEKILAFLAEKQKTTVKELCSDMKVSPATIRRDLIRLEGRGLVRRTHGWVLYADPAVTELPFDRKEAMNLREKRKIAKAVIRMIQPGHTICLDGGTTTLPIARALGDIPDLTVVTTSIKAAVELSTNHTAQVILCGGTVRGLSLTTVGPLAEEILERMNVDLVVVGTNGVSENEGLTTTNLPEAGTKAAMIRKGRKVVLATDSSKFGDVSFTRFATMADIHHVITDSLLRPEYKTWLKRSDTELTMV